MTCRYRSLKAFALALLTAIATGHLEASSPIYREPPPKEALEFLDLLVSEEVTVETLRPIIHSVVGERFGTKDRIGGILGVAVYEGAVKKSIAVRAMNAEGCYQDAHPGAGSCGRLVSGFKNGMRGNQITKPALGMSSSSSADELEAELVRDRAQVIRAETESLGGNAAYRAEYARALISRSDRPLEAALRYFLITSPEELPDSEDQKVFRAMGRVTVRGKVQEGVDPGAFRDPFGAVFRQRIEAARGDPQIVTEVRSIPEDLLTRVRELDSKSTLSFLAGNPVGCVVDAWRKGAEPMNRWAAWKQQLICQGW